MRLRKFWTFLDRVLSWAFDGQMSQCPICRESYGPLEDWPGTLWVSFGRGIMVCGDCVEEAGRRNAETEDERALLALHWYKKNFPDLFLEGR